jgi:hypothetical protein
MKAKPKDKYYGHAVIRHPKGFYYLVMFLDEKRELGNSKMLLSWKENGDLLPFD